MKSLATEKYNQINRVSGERESETNFNKRINKTTICSIESLGYDARGISKQNDKVTFINADLNEKWPVKNNVFDLVTINLVLEHITAIKIKISY